MNTHHIKINNLNSFMKNRNGNKDMVLGFNIKDKILCEITNGYDDSHIIKIGNFPAWRKIQDILDIMFMNIMSNDNVQINDKGMFYNNNFMAWE